MDSYTSLAKYYDELTRDVGYEKWAKYLNSIFKKHETHVGCVLDLACGTGGLSLALSDSGYDVIGVDASCDMLALACCKSPCSGKSPMFLKQDMRELDLYGTVDAAVCCLDSINYLTSSEDLSLALGRLKLFIRPGGLFVFDINTDGKYKKMSGNVFIRETKDIFCVWDAHYDENHRLCEMNLDIFGRRGELWERESEKHVQYAHTDIEIKAALSYNGFEVIMIYDELSLKPAKTNSERVFYVTRRKEEKPD